ncbi:MAG: hypothetical protein LQ346_004346 [Caloplaca aetnensis]|nr:MAG: hypothetical protein LQ346_004346 [Caloplaca aetnensis]
MTTTLPSPTNRPSSSAWTTPSQLRTKAHLTPTGAVKFFIPESPAPPSKNTTSPRLSVATAAAEEAPRWESCGACQEIEAKLLERGVLVREEEYGGRGSAQFPTFSFPLATARAYEHNSHKDLFWVASDYLAHVRAFEDLLVDQVHKGAWLHSGDGRDRWVDEVWALRGKAGGWRAELEGLVGGDGRGLLEILRLTCARWEGGGWCWRGEGGAVVLEVEDDSGTGVSVVSR